MAWSAGAPVTGRAESARHRWAGFRLYVPTARRRGSAGLPGGGPASYPRTGCRRHAASFPARQSGPGRGRNRRRGRASPDRWRRPRRKREPEVAVADGIDVGKAVRGEGEHRFGMAGAEGPCAARWSRSIRRSHRARQRRVDGEAAILAHGRDDRRKRLAKERAKRRPACRVQRSGRQPWHGRRPSAGCPRPQRARTAWPRSTPAIERPDPLAVPLGRKAIAIAGRWKRSSSVPRSARRRPDASARWP